MGRRRWESLLNVANDAMGGEDLEKLPAAAVNTMK